AIPRAVSQDAGTPGSQARRTRRDERGPTSRTADGSAAPSSPFRTLHGRWGESNTRPAGSTLPNVVVQTVSAHRTPVTDVTEFYQLLTYKYDVNLEANLAEWEGFYNLTRPHGAHRGKTPYEVLRERLAAA